jgi:hypothetical protein
MIIHFLWFILKLKILFNHIYVISQVSTIITTIQTSQSTKAPNINPISSVIIGTNFLSNYNSIPLNYFVQIPITTEFGAIMNYSQPYEIPFYTSQGNFSYFSLFIFDQLGNPMIPLDYDNTFSLVYTEIKDSI